MSVLCKINAVKLHYTSFPPCLSNHLSDSHQSINSDPNQQQPGEERSCLSDEAFLEVYLKVNTSKA